MRIAIALALMATPAMAHHEAVVASSLPALLPWIAVASAAAVGAWHRWLRRK